MKIGIFDSGIGGISVLHEAYHRLPNEEYIFYADVDHVPYGVKSSEEIKGFVDEIVGKLYGMGVDAIVIACNTATAVGAAFVREKYDIPIIGMEPAVKPAIEVAERTSGRVLVMATPVTIRENKLHDLLVRLDTDHKVDLLPMPGLVRMAESEIFEGADVDDYIEEQLAVFDKEKYSEVVLGCTHFNYFKPAISKAFHGKVQLIDGNAGTVNRIAELLGIEIESEAFDFEKVFPEMNNRTTYYLSGRPVSERGEDDLFMRLHSRLESVRLI